MTEAYPLAWPPGWPRTSAYDRQRHGSMDDRFGRAVQGIIKEIDMLGGTDAIISSNVELRQDGLPYANRRHPDDPGIAVYFNLDGNSQCIPCDKWLNIGQNLRAIEMTINALRGLERWGAKEMVSAAFRGFKALPEGGHPADPEPTWWEVLGVPRHAAHTEVLTAYRRKIRVSHPDQGGSLEDFYRIRTAWEAYQDSR